MLYPGSVGFFSHVTHFQRSQRKHWLFLDLDRYFRLLHMFVCSKGLYSLCSSDRKCCLKLFFNVLFNITTSELLLCRRCSDIYCWNWNWMDLKHFPPFLFLHCHEPTGHKDIQNPCELHSHLTQGWMANKKPFKLAKKCWNQSLRFTTSVKET